MRVRFLGGKIVADKSIIENGSVTIENDTIAYIGDNDSPCDMEINLDGKMLLPGFIDLHGDAIEKEIEPRPRVLFPYDVALRSIDRRCATSGITTAFHAISFAKGEFGVRDPEIASQLAKEIHKFNSTALINHKIHVRYEITDRDSEAIVAELLESGIVHMLSFMDHTPGQGQYKDAATYLKYLNKVYKSDDEDINKLIEDKKSESAYTAQRMERLANIAKQKNIPVAGHDDEGEDRIQFMNNIGADISEFPLDMETARSAFNKGMSTIFGAPNALRGKSTSGSISAREAIANGVASCLCSDYAPQTLLPAICVLMGELNYNLTDIIHLITSSPANAAKITNRGAIKPGNIADFIIVSGEGHNMSVNSVWVSGECRFNMGI